MSLLDLFGINKEVSPSDVVRNAPEIESKIEQTNKALQDILNENPDLVNNLQTNIATAEAPVGPMKIESPISKTYDYCFSMPQKTLKGFSALLFVSFQLCVCVCVCVCVLHASSRPHQLYFKSGEKPE